MMFYQRLSLTPSPVKLSRNIPIGRNSALTAGKDFDAALSSYRQDTHTQGECRNIYRGSVCEGENDLIIRCDPRGGKPPFTMLFNGLDPHRAGVWVVDRSQHSSDTDVMVCYIHMSGHNV
ncbi:uncharacterized protein [Hoplias malabaricus]|uniref:uncharacterized protein isoform X1 n=1 Tax=Hoplias malabaricus TaxID=27720 RepID=UPI0034619A7C